jgi:hypothetical protein
MPGYYNYHLVCPPAALDLAKVDAFRRWIEEEAREATAGPSKPPPVMAREDRTL